MPDQQQENTANNMDEFNAQARSFVAKAKQAGKSNTAMANTIRMKFQMYQMAEANKITPYQQAQLDISKEALDVERSKNKGDNWVLADVNDDGIQEWVNKETREIKGADVPGSDKAASFDLTDDDKAQDVVNQVISDGQGTQQADQGNNDWAEYYKQQNAKASLDITEEQKPTFWENVKSGIQKLRESEPIGPIAQMVQPAPEPIADPIAGAVGWARDKIKGIFG